MIYIKPLTVQLSSQPRKRSVMNTGWSGILYFCYRNTKILVRTFKIFCMKSTDSTYLKPIGLLNVLKSTLSLGCPCVLFYLILSRNKIIMETAMLKNKHMLKGDNYPDHLILVFLSFWFIQTQCTFCYNRQIELCTTLWDILDMMWSAQLKSLHTEDSLYQEANFILIYIYR